MYTFKMLLPTNAEIREVQIPWGIDSFSTPIFNDFKTEKKRKFLYNFLK